MKYTVDTLNSVISYTNINWAVYNTSPQSFLFVGLPTLETFIEL